MGITTFSKVSDIVRFNVQKYFEEHLPQYEVVQVGLSSEYIYRVLAKKKETSLFSPNDFACWTSWNESTQSLNYGHYDLPEWKATQIFMGYDLPINPYRLDELASKAINGLIIDGVESAVEYFHDEMDMEKCELEYFKGSDYEWKLAMELWDELYEEE